MARLPVAGSDNGAWAAVLNTFLGDSGISDNQIPYFSSGGHVGSANFTFDGTTLTVHTLTVSTGALDLAATVSFAASATALTIGNTTGFTNLRHTLFINDTSNANMTIGLTINQGTADNNILDFKSSDLDHGGVGGETGKEADTFAAFTKRSGTGGLIIDAIIDDATADTALMLVGTALDADVDAVDTATRTTVEILCQQHNSAGALANMEDNARAFSVRARVGGSSRTIFVVDEQGTLYSDQSATVGTFDKENDAEMCRALDLLSPMSIENKWDDFIRYKEQDLIRTGVLSGPITYKNERGATGLLNITKLQKLHNGAIWQGYANHRDHVEYCDNKFSFLYQENIELKQRLLALEGPHA